MYQLGLSISSMLGGLFSRGVNSAPHSRENGWSPGCPVPCSNQNNCKQNSPGLLLVGGTRCFGPAMDWCLLVVGEYKLYHSVWEPPIMCVAWKISRSLGCYVDNESIPLKILFTSISKPSSGTSTNPCFPLPRAYLFTSMLSHPPLIKKHQLESTAVICIHYSQFILSMTMTGSLLPWITMFSQSLIFKGSLHLRFAVSERASEIPSCYIILWLFWGSVVIRDLLLLLASWLGHWYE